MPDQERFMVLLECSANDQGRQLAREARAEKLKS
jgi:hypothetical protein